MNIERIASTTAVSMLLFLATAPAVAQDAPASSTITTTEHSETHQRHHRPPIGLLGLLGLIGLAGLRRRRDVVVESVDRVVPVATVVTPDRPIP